jgi:hypothetical protein
VVPGVIAALLCLALLGKIVINATGDGDIGCLRGLGSAYGSTTP